ncbi:hypothetical protein [Flavobacterium aciduliphilum]|jgi:hypothetical protein|uniref:Uncharacterized protein n=1 Tax=Flavobacterium aciduliphilum TaxID=1101402 RepID=A0A328YUG9_9FLAO|nr:hypothetical protein [Flavobacterium aciduliphilum]RAR74197.1 hypothetical protein CLV55_102128 [Flavobacterium aciduliphilum]
MQQAINLDKQTIEDFKGASVEEVKAFGNTALAGEGRLIVFSILILIIFSIARRCN